MTWKKLRWQAGSDISHYYNLYSDYNVGIIDRHNYFGATPHSITPGVFKNSSMFNYPGSGLISSGLMSVKDRPFVFSEWTVKMPTEWTADGPAIIGVYGMGLQDWDGSFHFASGRSGFSEKMEDPNVYNTNNITQIGLFPAIARMIYRNDVHEGKVLPNRKVHIQSLMEGKIGFKEEIKQEADIKELGGDVPIDALMEGKLQLEFTDKFKKSNLKGYKKILDEKSIVSNTGELEWFRDGNGCFSVNTEGTKAVCGFTNGKLFRMGDFEISTESPYSMIFITATEKSKTLKTSKSILVTTLARAQNTGMKITMNGKESELTEKGVSPLLIEPVKATIRFNTSKKFSVCILDHDGMETNKTIRVENNTFLLDGASTNAIWYEIKLD